MKLVPIASAFALAAVVAAAVPPTSLPEGIEVGAEPTYTFRETPVNAMGIKSLADMKGRPVLVEFWGTL